MSRRVRSCPPAFVLADKPAGMGSAALVAALRRELGGPRAGHAGTLDRFATGLMVLLLGRATALADVLLHQDKTYLATFQFGRSTDTLDPEGTVLAERSPAETADFLEQSREPVAAALAGIMAATEQVPPVYSALKIGGRRFSDLARAGKIAEPVARSVRIDEMTVLNYRPEAGQVEARIAVSSGTYIRSIARDLGRLVDFPVHLSALRRLRIGALQIGHSGLWQPGRGLPVLQSPLEALPHWPVFAVSADQTGEIRLGRKILVEGMPAAGVDFFLTGAEGLVAWCRAERGGGYEFRRVFSE